PSRMLGSSRNSRKRVRISKNPIPNCANRWSNRLQRVKSWVLSLARRLTFSRCSTRLQKVLHDCVIRRIPLSGAEIMKCWEGRPHTAEVLSPERDGHQSTGPLHLAELWSMDRLFTSTTLRPAKVSFRGLKIMEYEPVSARRWLHRRYVKALQS